MNLLESLVKYDKMVVKENMRLKKIYNAIVSESCEDGDCNETADVMDNFEIEPVDETDMPNMRGRGGIQKELPTKYNPDFGDEEYDDQFGKEEFDDEMAEIHRQADGDLDDVAEEDDEMANPVVGEDKDAAAWFGKPVKEDDLLMGRVHNRHGSLNEKEDDEESDDEEDNSKKKEDLDEAEFNDVGMFDPMGAAVDGLAETEEFDEGQNLKLQPIDDFLADNSGKEEMMSESEFFAPVMKRRARRR